jgi:hypothetical protein
MTEFSQLATPLWSPAIVRPGDHSFESAVHRHGIEARSPQPRQLQLNSSPQARGVPAQMIAHESGDEVVAVIVTALAA